MKPDQPDSLSLPVELALAHCPADLRPAAQAAFALDARLAKFVAQANEPLVAQLRLAWWREQLAMPRNQRARGDEILDGISASWADFGHGLVELVDGWEQMLADPPLPVEAVRAWLAGRAEVFSGLAKLAGCEGDADAARHAGETWALGDLLQRVSPEECADLIAALPDAAPHPEKLPRRLRHLTILGSLGRRAIRRGGGPLVSGRRDLLHIMRLGMFGR